MTHRPPLALVGGVLWLSLLAPPLRAALEATMTAQMLVQLPLLGAAGWMVARAVPAPVERALAQWDGGGVPGLLLASLASAVWMLPRMLDAAVDDPATAALKFMSVPLLVGVPIALSWPRAGFVVRGVVLLEAVASAFRLGWLYLIAPERLCSNYLLGDQQLLGKSLLALGAVACLVIAWRLMWGHVRVEPDVP
ncbi:MAG: hypothetical protein IT361_02835 [Gemmatimonadaceae bacterium]|nr:hypothetical protein [Gemmatimonadaceae bacterium]